MREHACTAGAPTGARRGEIACVHSWGAHGGEKGCAPPERRATSSPSCTRILHAYYMHTACILHLRRYVRVIRGKNACGLANAASYPKDISTAAAVEA